MPENLRSPLLVYRESRSEESFRELVAEHVDHVYSTALRRCNGNASMAEEVTQATFCELANKALSLPAGTVVGGQKPQAAISAVVESWTAKDPNEAGRWISGLTGTADYDAAAGAFVSGILGTDPESGLAWAKTIGEEKRRMEAIADVGRSWLGTDPSGATNALLKAGVSQDEINQIKNSTHVGNVLHVMEGFVWK